MRWQKLSRGKRNQGWALGNKAEMQRPDPRWMLQLVTTKAELKMGQLSTGRDTSSNKIKQSNVLHVIKL